MPSTAGLKVGDRFPTWVALLIDGVEGPTARQYFVLEVVSLDEPDRMDLSGFDGFSFTAWTSGYSAQLAFYTAPTDGALIATLDVEIAIAAGVDVRTH
jgi:hypothetical protein